MNYYFLQSDNGPVVLEEVEVLPPVTSTMDSIENTVWTEASTWIGAAIGISLTFALLNAFRGK